MLSSTTGPVGAAEGAPDSDELAAELSVVAEPALVVGSADGLAAVDAGGVVAGVDDAEGDAVPPPLQAASTRPSEATTATDARKCRDMDFPFEWGVTGSALRTATSAGGAKDQAGRQDGVPRFLGVTVHQTQE